MGKIRKIEGKKLNSMKESEFLMRMSHEIRTPMNAICGMADLLLQSGLDGLKRDYVNTIKTASDNLLGIVDDIVDIIQMEYGEIELFPETYELRTLVEEITAFMNQQLEKSKVSFLIRLDLNLPELLYGDVRRIRQILRNLLTNAIKYTEKGFICLSISLEKCETSKEAFLKFEVEDSGIGIREEDKERVFEHFYQVDSKQNRKVDGVGLGLSICRLLAEYMGGKILLDSEPAAGSVFTFILKQEIHSQGSFMENIDLDGKKALVYEKDSFYCENMENIRALCLQIGLMVYFAENKQEFLNLLEEEQYNYIFFDYSRAFYDVRDLFLKYPDKIFTAMVGKDIEKPKNPECSNYFYIYKPLTLYSIADVLKGRKNKGTRSGQKFIAPDLNVMVIDDNPVNLKVAQGLISAYQCRITTVTSGYEAIEQLKENQDFDLLFIDHMMPDLDGIQTLHLIRAELGDYGKEVTAVALTANVLPQARRMFLEQGFQAFLAKPINEKYLHEIMNQFVLEEKKQLDGNAIDMIGTNITEEDRQRVAMKGVDAEIGLRNCGNKVEKYLEILQVTLSSGKIKVQDLKRYALEKNYEAYGIEAHAFKSVAASIGAMKQSELAREHEFAVKNGDYKKIAQEYQKLLNGYQKLLLQIQATLDKEENKVDNKIKKTAVEEAVWKEKIRETIAAIEEFNQKRASRLLEELSGYQLSDSVSVKVEEALEKMKLFDDEAAEQTLRAIKL